MGSAPIFIALRERPIARSSRKPRSVPRFPLVQKFRSWYQCYSARARGLWEYASATALDCVTDYRSSYVRQALMRAWSEDRSRLALQWWFPALVVGTGV